MNRNPDDIVQSVVGSFAIEGIELSEENFAELKAVARGDATADEIITQFIQNHPQLGADIKKKSDQ